MAEDVAPQEAPQKKATLADAAPPEIVLYTENFDVKPGHMIVEQLRVALGGDEQAGVTDLLASVTAIATAMPDPTNQASAVQILEVGSEAAVKMWLGASGLPQADSVEGAEIYGANPMAVVAWAPKHKLLMFGPPSTVGACLRAANGGPSLESTIGELLHVDETASTMVVLNVPQLSSKFEPLVAAIHNLGEESTFSARSASEPLMSSLALGDADGRSVAGYLPKETIVYVSLATPDKETVTSLLGERAALLTKKAQAVSKALDALGGTVTLFAAAAPTLELSLQKRDLTDVLIGVVIELKKGHGLGDAWLAEAKAQLAESGGDLSFALSLHGDRLLVVAGDPALAAAASRAQSGKGALAAEDKHKTAMADLPDKAQGWLWADAGWVMSSLSKLVPPAQRKALAAIPSAPGSLALRALLEGDRWRYDLKGRNVMGLAALGGMASAIAIYSVRRYLAAAKASEARQVTSQIAHAAAGRHTKDGRVCRTSTAVPAEVPAGEKHAPAATDWGGDDKTGWKCLGFSITSPHYYRYSYLGPGATSRKNDLPLPPGHFEAIAEGDLDADGVTSLFIVSGHVEGKKMVVDDQMQIKKQLE